MNATPALHPRHLNVSDAAPAPDSPAADAMGDGRVPPLKVVPCSPEFDVDERREYAGVHARHLAYAAPELIRLKIENGLGAISHSLRNFTTKMRNALYMYSRVKRALRWLEAPQKVSVFINDVPPRHGLRRKSVDAVSRPAFKWEVAPKDVYQWEACITRYGYDVRGTSLDWVERQVIAARSNARRKALREFKAREGVSKPTSVTPAPTLEGDDVTIETRVFEPLSGQFGEIWPPVPVPAISEAPVTVTPDYLSERRAARMADPDAAVIGVVFIEDETTGGDFRDDGTWWLLTGHYDITDTGLVYAPDVELKPP